MGSILNILKSINPRYWENDCLPSQRKKNDLPNIKIRKDSYFDSDSSLSLHLSDDEFAKEYVSNEHVHNEHDYVVFDSTNNYYNNNS